MTDDKYNNCARKTEEHLKVKHVMQELRRDYRYMIYNEKIYGYDLVQDKLYLIVKIKEYIYYCNVENFPTAIKEHLEAKK